MKGEVIRLPYTKFFILFSTKRGGCCVFFIFCPDQKWGYLTPLSLTPLWLWRTIQNEIHLKPKQEINIRQNWSITQTSPHPTFRASIKFLFVTVEKQLGCKLWKKIGRCWTEIKSGWGKAITYFLPPSTLIPYLKKW